jgi:nucleoside-diphosphate-sugar epimerase
MNTIVITGATSMIGIAIVDECLKHHNDVKKIYAVVKPNTAKLNRIPKDDRIEIVECSIEEYTRLPALIKTPCDVFYHIAWSVTGAARNENIIGQAINIQYTLEALQVAKALGCAKFIGAGSQAEYGKLNLDKISEVSPINPIQPYGIAKYAAGKLAAEEAKKIGIDFFWVRIFSVYGKYDKPSTMISSSITKLLAGEHTSYTLAEQQWDYLYSEDAGKAFYLIGKICEGNKVYCLGSGKSRPLREYIEILGQIVAPQAVLGIGELSYNENTVMNICADIKEICTDTGWYPSIDFSEGIKRTINNLKNLEEDMH